MGFSRDFRRESLISQQYSEHPLTPRFFLTINQFIHLSIYQFINLSIQNTKYKIQNTKYNIQHTKYKIKRRVKKKCFFLKT